MSISQSEIDYIIKGIDGDMRQDGRGRLDYRPIYIETGMLPQANGSARCQLGDGTDVLVGIKAETMDLNLTMPDLNLGRIEIDVECSPSSSQEFEGRGADFLNGELTQQLERILGGPQGGIDLEKLCIIPGKACWVIYIDALVLGMGGNLLEAIVYATRCALQTTMIPNTIIEDVGQGVLEFEVDGDEENSRPLPGFEDIPVVVSLTKIANRYVVDCNLMEEQCGDAIVHIGVNRAGQITSVQKGAFHSIDPSMLLEMISSASALGLQAIQGLKSRLTELPVNDNNSEGGMEDRKISHGGFLA